MFLSNNTIANYADDHTPYPGCIIYQEPMKIKGKQISSASQQHLSFM